MLLRTLTAPQNSRSIAQLHETAGLRFVFSSEEDRAKFAAAFATARLRTMAASPNVVGAIFESWTAAEWAVAELIGKGISEDSISLLQRTDIADEPRRLAMASHSPLNVALVTTGAGVIGAMLGVAICFVPGIGMIAAAGAASSSALFSATTVGGIAGATGGAISRLLTDLDIDQADARHIEWQIRSGKVFLCVDTRTTADSRSASSAILSQAGGRLLRNPAPDRHSVRSETILKIIHDVCS